MSYTITLTDGTVFATIADGTINTTASPALTLVGKNYAGYGQFLNTNFIRVLENSSNPTAPPAPITGQLWWEKTTLVMVNFWMKILSRCWKILQKPQPLLLR